MSTDEAAAIPEAAEAASISFGRRIFLFLISMKLALTLLFVIAIISVIGSFLPQGDQVYMTDWVNNPLFDFYNTIGLFDMYWSWWYQALLALLAVNLTVCIFNRLGPAWRKTFNPRVDVKDAFVTSQPFAARFQGAGAGELKAATGVLKSGRYHITRGRTGSVLARKGRFSDLASLFFHASFLVIGIGAIIGYTLGFDETMEIPDGKIANVPSTSYQAKNHGFEIKSDDLYENDRLVGYRISEFSTDLEVFLDGKPVARKTITVNDPLRLDGVNFYQSSYDITPRGRVTILQVNHYPAKTLVYIGFGLMVGGIVFALYFPQRRIWLKQGKSGELLMGGRANRSKVSFQKEFDGLVTDMRLQLKQEARADGNQ